MDMTSVYLEIQQSINSGSVFSLPREKLELFVAALSRAQAYTNFGASEFPGTCETVRMALSMRVSEDANQQAKKDSRTALRVSWLALIVGIGSLIAALWPVVFPGPLQVYATPENPVSIVQNVQMQRSQQEPMLQVPAAKQ